VTFRVDDVPGTDSFGVELDNFSLIRHDLAVDDVNVVQTAGASGQAVFGVSLTFPQSTTVMVDYTTTPGTGTPGIDYLPASGTLIFLPGETSKTVPVTIPADARHKGTQTFFLDLSGASGGATISRARGTAFVLSDNANHPPQPAGPGDQAVQAGQALDLQLSAGDADLPKQTLTFSLVQGPSGLTVSPNGQLTWTTDSTTSPGAYSVLVQVSDGETVTPTAFTVTVSEPPPPPNPGPGPSPGGATGQPNPTGPTTPPATESGSSVVPPSGQDVLSAVISSITEGHGPVNAATTAAPVVGSSSIDLQTISRELPTGVITVSGLTDTVVSVPDRSALPVPPVTLAPGVPSARPFPSVAGSGYAEPADSELDWLLGPKTNPTEVE
jgi:hypothetical protein